MINDKFTRDEDKRFTLRIDKNLFQKVEQSAKKNKRAIGREIEFILEQYFENNHKE
ncbi:TPA: Arc family DNA-binding protein [Staphylococcus aureus]|nr:Arc family DNA-binding protein [Staphylococcus aureus]HDD0464789.1 Arc family DNA-binding protein [Staphylococcus aureus]HDD0467453.1 Arc family DNA-binding protein [Staphylococcus aureus]